MNAPNTDATIIPNIVTTRDLYIKLDKLEDTVAGYGLSGMKEQVTDHEYRIRELEKWVWRASGLAALAGAGISIIIQELVGRVQ